MFGASAASGEARALERGLGGAIGPRRRSPAAAPLAGEPWPRKEGPLGDTGSSLWRSAT